MDRYVCVHGHFYQPPRENPWLEVVELQESARPYHDWNERITLECYEPNSAARMLDDAGRIDRLVNNYAWTSFNVGPTLLQWLDDHSPDAYAGIVEGDRLSRENFGGHGSAIAQIYNHVIMPLANERDRRTQVVWGIRDFEHRFDRPPEGMWLSETAVDTPTLELLAEHGIRFTILSPYQAARTRPIDTDSWEDVTGGHVDPSRPYRVQLPSGARISVFFYDGPIAQGVAFEGLLDSGDDFADRLLAGFSDRAGPQLAHIATDGESYGHHHHQGEMALAHALHRILQSPEVRLTNYAEYLALHPPEYEAEIIEESSWSCAHGVERWRSDCGCSTGQGTSQAWREPLRNSLDWLRDQLAPVFEREAKQLLRDPWAARDDYVEVVLDRTPERIRWFVERHAQGPLDEVETTRVLRLMELQRHAMLMYTSCGWFFDELSRIETVQVLHYAARALQLAEQLTEDDELEAGFLERLALAESNQPQFTDGRDVYRRLVLPSIADFGKVAAHFATTRLFHEDEPPQHLGCYEVERHDERISQAGRTRIASGRLTVRSVITRREKAFEYGVLHFGELNFVCGIRDAGDDAAFAAMVEDLEAAFEEGDVTTALRRLDTQFPGDEYTLKDLFRDEQHRIIDLVLDRTLVDLEATYRSMYRGRTTLMRLLTNLEVNVPPALLSAAEVVINAELREAITQRQGPDRIKPLLDEAARFGITLDDDGLGHVYATAIEAEVQQLASHLDDPQMLSSLGDESFDEPGRDLVSVLELLPFTPNLNRVQNLCWRLLQVRRPILVVHANAGMEPVRRWIERLDHIASALGIAVPEPPVGGARQPAGRSPA